MVLFAICLSACIGQPIAPTPLPPTREIVCPFGSQIPAEFELGSNRPLDLIRFLEKRYVTGGSNVITLPCYHRNWVTREDLPQLEALIDSTTPCAAIVGPLESTLPVNGTTVGKIARELLDSFREGGFPLNLKDFAKE